MSLLPAAKSRPTAAVAPELAQDMVASQPKPAESRLQAAKFLQRQIQERESAAAARLLLLIVTSMSTSATVLLLREPIMLVIRTVVQQLAAEARITAKNLHRAALLSPAVRLRPTAPDMLPVSATPRAVPQRERLRSPAAMSRPRAVFRLPASAAATTPKPVRLRSAAAQSKPKAARWVPASVPAPAKRLRLIWERFQFRAARLTPLAASGLPASAAAIMSVARVVLPSPAEQSLPPEAIKAL